MNTEAKEVCNMDYERAYDRVSRENAVLEEKNKILLEALIKIITEVL